MRRGTALLAMAWWLASCACEAPHTSLDASIDARASAPDAMLVCGVERSAADGAPCICDSDCMAGAACWGEIESGETGGTCGRLCETGPCADDAVCIDTTGRCAQLCALDSECGPRRVCGLEGYCEGLCFADSDCDSGFCDRPRSQCTDGTTRGGSPIGSACLDAHECTSELCFAGECMGHCSATHGRSCPEGSTCSILTGDTGVCATHPVEL